MHPTTPPAASTPRRSLTWQVRRFVNLHQRLAVALVLGGVLLGVLAAHSGRSEPDRTSTGARLATAHPGLTALPIRFPDADAAALLGADDHITLIATSGSTSETLCSATVLTVARNGVVIVGVAPSAVARVTAASASSYLTFAFTG